MALTDEQQLKYNNAFYYYLEALQNVRATYLRLLEVREPKVSKEDEKNIWDASCILRYMMENHEKYRSLLEFLTRSKRELAILGRLLDKVTVDPNSNLQGFIDEVQKFMRDKEFKSDLDALSNRYQVEGIALSIATVFMVIGGILSLPLMALVHPMLLTLLPLFALAGLPLGFMADERFKQRNTVEHSIQLFVAIEPKTYDLTEKDKHGSIVKIHQPQSKGNLRRNFFKPQMQERDALVQEVQSEFRSFIETPC